MVRRPAALSAATFEERFDALVNNVERVIQGKRDVITLALTCLVADGHLLIEDVPGVGKTMLAKAIARSIDGTWHRIQFTPDLLPSDVTGVSVWNRGSNEFEFRARRRLRQHRPGRRGQPGLAQDAVRPAGGDGGAPGDGRRRHPPAPPPVHGHRHPEPDRVRGHLPAARGPARPVPHAGQDGLPRPRRRDRHPRDPRRGRARRRPRLRPHRRRHREPGRGGHLRLRGPQPEGLHHRRGRGHPARAGPGARASAPGGRCPSSGRPAPTPPSAGRDYVTPTTSSSWLAACWNTA